MSHIIANDEHQRLLKDSIKLNCLLAVGVRNWEGFKDAMEMFEELENSLKKIKENYPDAKEA